MLMGSPVCCMREKERSGKDEREVNSQLQTQWLKEKAGDRCFWAECWARNANVGLHPFFADSSYFDM